MYRGNVEIIVINEIYKASVIEYFFTDSHITQSRTVIVGQVVTEMIESHLFSVGPDIDHNYPLLLVKHEEKLGIFDTGFVDGLPKMISLDSSIT
jgi:hypothetical protein